jgi:hypothetical protein
VPEVPEIDHAQILALEQCALNAWPALHTRFAGGWALRLADGCTKRANSANPLAPDSPFAQVQATAERFYRRAGQPAVFRLTPLAPPDADGALAAAGYDLRDPSRVMIAPLSDAPRPWHVKLAAQADAEWLAGVTSANATPPQLRTAHAAIVGAIRQPAAFATVREGGRSVGFGMAVAEQGYRPVRPDRGARATWPRARARALPGPARLGPDPRRDARLPAGSGRQFGRARALRDARLQARLRLSLPRGRLSRFGRRLLDDSDPRR